MLCRCYYYYYLVLLSLVFLSCTGDYSKEYAPLPNSREDTGVVKEEKDVSLLKKENFKVGRVKIERKEYKNLPSFKETCNKNDDDRDGVVDEGCACAYKDLPGKVCISIISAEGKCKEPPNYQEKETACDSRDNDCDGDIDEGCKDWNCILPEVCEVDLIEKRKKYLFIEATCPDKEKLFIFPKSQFNEAQEQGCWYIDCAGQMQDRICEE